LKPRLLTALALAALVALSLTVGGATGTTNSRAGSTAGSITIDIQPVLRTQKVVTVTLPKPTKAYQLGFVVPLLSEPGEASVAAGTRKAAKLAGAKIDIQDAVLDVSKQVQLADSMLDRGYDGILTIDLFAHTMDAFYKRADAKHVPTITEYSTRPGGVKEAWQTPGKEAVQIILKQYPKGATGVMLSDTPAPVIKDREKGFRQAVATTGGKVKVLELKRNLKETLDGARAAAEDLLQGHPDIKFIWASNDVGAIASGLAAKAAGKKLIITGMNGDPSAVDAVKKGLITATWDANQNAAGELMVIHALQWLLTGKKPPVTVNPFTRIDASNASQYIPWPARAKVKR
jgi:ribose transport system substrate-binding protein